MRSAPPGLPLERDAVHVWHAGLSLPPDQLERLRQALSADERERAARFVFAKDRDRFVAARGILRDILGNYLGQPGGALRFEYGPYGKPALAGEPRGLRFNVSHSGDLALVAVTRGQEIGIDVEAVRPERADEQLARRFFSPREVAALLALPEAERGAAFFACWTRKEAYIKARGDGLSIPLDAFDVSLAPGEACALLRASGDDPARWALRALDTGPGYAAALAVEGHGWRLSTRRWEGQGCTSVRHTAPSGVSG